MLAPTPHPRRRRVVFLLLTVRRPRLRPYPFGNIAGGPGPCQGGALPGPRLNVREVVLLYPPRAHGGRGRALERIGQRRRRFGTLCADEAHSSVISTSNSSRDISSTGFRTPAAFRSLRHARVFWKSLSSLHEPLNRLRIVRTIPPAGADDIPDIPQSQNGAGHRTSGQGHLENCHFDLRRQICATLPP